MILIFFNWTIGDFERDFGSSRLKILRLKSFIAMDLVERLSQIIVFAIRLSRQYINFYFHL